MSFQVLDEMKIADGGPARVARQDDDELLLPLHMLLLYPLSTPTL